MSFAGAMIFTLGFVTVPPANGQIMIRPNPTARAVPPPPGGAQGQAAGEPAKSSAAESSNDFFYDLFAKLRQSGGEQGDMFFSPFSISSALAMTRIGAAGATADQMSAVLHLSADLPAVEASFQLLNHLLVGDAQNAGLTIDIANALWGQKDEPFLPGYLAVVKQDFDADLIPVDFRTQPDPTRQQINDWVAHKTQDKIKDLLPPGAITPDTRLVLTNAVYFKGKWRSPFQASRTIKGDFHGYAAEPIQAELMHQTVHLQYAEDDQCQMIKLPYQDAPADQNTPMRSLSMVILLPKPDNAIDAVRKGDGIPAGQRMLRLENSISADYLAKLTNQLAEREVRLTLPKWQSSQAFSLNSTLTQMGMRLAFTRQADFSGINGKTDLFVSDVIHKAFITVDESGTEAAAATGVVMRATAVRAAPPPVDFTADHPFLYLIVNDQTGAILFAGRLTDPTARK
jgi:serpin B